MSSFYYVLPVPVVRPSGSNPIHRENTGKLGCYISKESRFRPRQSMRKERRAAPRKEPGKAFPAAQALP